MRGGRGAEGEQGPAWGLLRERGEGEGLAAELPGFGVLRSILGAGRVISAPLVLQAVWNGHSLIPVHILIPISFHSASHSYPNPHPYSHSHFHSYSHSHPHPHLSLPSSPHPHSITFYPIPIPSHPHPHPHSHFHPHPHPHPIPSPSKSCQRTRGRAQQGCTLAAAQERLISLKASR